MKDFLQGLIDRGLHISRVYSVSLTEPKGSLSDSKGAWGKSAGAAVSVAQAGERSGLSSEASSIHLAVDHWRNSSQKHRWVSTALLEIEPGLRKVKGFRELWKLSEALRGDASLLREAA